MFVRLDKHTIIDLNGVWQVRMVLTNEIMFCYGNRESFKWKTTSSKKRDEVFNKIMKALEAKDFTEKDDICKG